MGGMISLFKSFQCHRNHQYTGILRKNLTRQLLQEFEKSLSEYFSFVNVQCKIKYFTILSFALTFEIFTSGTKSEKTVFLFKVFNVSNVMKTNDVLA